MEPRYLFLASLVLACAATASAQYQSATLPIPMGAIGVGASAINQEHQIALNAAFPINDAVPGTASSYTLPYLWSNGTLTALPVGNGFVSGSVLGLNDSGAAVGFVTNANGENFPALWSGGALTLLDHGTFPEGVAFSINNQGQIAGQITTHSASNFISNAALWNGTILTNLGSFGGTQAFAAGVNNSGKVLIIADGAPSSVIIHDSLTDNTIDARGATAINNQGQVLVVGSNNINYLWQDEILTALPSTIGSYFDAPMAMNNVGDVVGFTLTHDFASKAVLWQGGQEFDLSSLLGDGWDQTNATGIANDGSIVAIGTYQGQVGSVLLTPTASPSGAAATPEPATAATLLLAAPLLLRRRRRSV